MLELGEEIEELIGAEKKPKHVRELLTRG